MADEWQNGFGEGLTFGRIESERQLDDLRFCVRAIANADGEQAIFNLCRALGDATEAAEVVRNEWRRL